MRAARRLRNLTAHIRRVGTDERIRSAAVGYGRLDYPGAEILLGLSSRAEYHRLGSCAKEPWTVRWIERYLKPGEVLYDVGANIGAYSLLAAVLAPQARVVAFEPGPGNYAALCANLELNSVTDRAIALPLALGDEPRAAPLGRDASVPGASMALEPGPPETPAITALVERLDDVIERFRLPAPTHMKLDVDGAEGAVLAGGKGILASGELRSLMVELDLERGGEVIEFLDGFGYGLVERSTGANRARNSPDYGLFTRR